MYSVYAHVHVHCVVYLHVHVYVHGLAINMYIDLHTYTCVHCFHDGTRPYGAFFILLSHSKVFAQVLCWDSVRQCTRPVFLTIYMYSFLYIIIICIVNANYNLQGNAK